jgi:hypothetical protein
MKQIGNTEYYINENGDCFDKNLKKISSDFDKYGYKNVRLTINGKRKRFTVHRLVAKTFIPNPDNKPCVDHIDRIRSNSHVSNLRWVTVRENCNNTKEIKSIYCYNNKTYLSSRYAAEDLGLNPNSVKTIMNNHNCEIKGYRFKYV